MGPKVTPDAFVIKACTGDRNLLVPHYLIHSWLYYEADCGVVTDDTWTWLFSKLQTEWDAVEHFHKHLLPPRSSLQSGYGMAYPRRVIGGAVAFVADYAPGSLGLVLERLKS